MDEKIDSHENLGFLCSCDESHRGACDGLPFFKSKNERDYCVLHFPGSKEEEFSKAVRHKLSKGDSNFVGVWFAHKVEFFGACFQHEAKFDGALFFDYVTFAESVFRDAATFVGAQFKGVVNFSNARFEGPTNFTSAQFHKRAVFDATRFGDEALFTFAEFSGETDFQRASFSSLTMFDFVVIKDSLTLGARRDYSHVQGFANTASFSLEGARIDHPENVTFRTLSLRPGWFVNADIRKFNFVEVKWIGLNERGFDFDLNEDIADLERNVVEIPHRVLAIAYRQLAINAEENHRYREASLFRYRSMDVRRSENSSIWAVLTLDWWYWIASGYGERVGRAFLILVLLCLTFGITYSFVGFGQTNSRTSQSANLSVANDTSGVPIRPFHSALLYSAELVTLQKPEPKPLTPLARALVTLETVLGPTQLTLLALAIRRKFMR